MQQARRNFILGALSFGTPFIFATPGKAQQNQSHFAGGRLARVVSGDVFELQDGRVVRLAGVVAPRPPTGSKAGQPLWQEAKSQLREILQGHELVFHQVGHDRFGRIVSHVMAGPKGIWAQGQMLRLGFARVKTSAQDHSRARLMLRLENESRIAKNNIWRHGFYRVRQPDALDADFGSFQIVAGKILSVANGRSNTYLNFGPNWRQDFTAQANRKVTRAFAKAGMRLSRLSGRNVQVRGLILPQNGALIKLGHPSQLEHF